MSQILEVCARLDRRAFVANHDGNVSVRLSEDRFLVTPTAYAKADVNKEDLLVIDREGQVLEGRHRVFSEWKWHRAIYFANPDVTSVVHAHPPHSMGWGLLKKDFGYPAIPEAVVSLGGAIPTLETNGVSESHDQLLRHVKSALSSSYAFLVPGNGVFAVGDNAIMAYLRVELAEQVIKAHMLAKSVGGIQALDAQLIQSLKSKTPALKPQWAVQDSSKGQKEVATPSLGSHISSQSIEELVRLELVKRGIGSN